MQQGYTRVALACGPNSRESFLRQAQGCAKKDRQGPGDGSPPVSGLHTGLQQPSMIGCWRPSWSYKTFSLLRSGMFCRAFPEERSW